MAIPLSEVVHDALALAIAEHTARDDGHDYATLREFGTFRFGDPSTQGPNKDDYSRPAYDLVDALTLSPIPFAELVMIWRRVVDPAL